MKRRNFLASLAALSLATSEAWAAKKQDNKSASSKSSTNKSKPAAKKTTSTKPAAKNSSKPKAPVAHTPDDSIVEKPPQGSSASRLPPVKAAEPPAEWRTYEILTTVSLREGRGSKLWLPLPFSQDTLFQRTLGHSWHGNPGQGGIHRLPDGDLEVFHCEWQDSGEQRLQLKTLVTTADRHFDVTKRTVAPERDDILRRSLQATRLIPNDGLAHQLGERIIGRIKDPVAQAKAIFDWVVENTIYDPSLPGCGTGDVRRQLIAGQYGGRSADINGLFVAICRGIGIPARCVYGLRIGPSRLFRSLGLSGEEASRAQHVRAEFYIPGYGWIPVDPSDVRRAIALEIISDRDSRLASLRKVLFGVWEMNWIAFNLGQDISLPGQNERQSFILYPQLESNGRHLGSQGPGAFQYSITARRVEL